MMEGILWYGLYEKGGRLILARNTHHACMVELSRKTKQTWYQNEKEYKIVQINIQKATFA